MEEIIKKHAKILDDKKAQTTNKIKYVSKYVENAANNSESVALNTFLYQTVFCAAFPRFVRFLSAREEIPAILTDKTAEMEFKIFFRLTIRYPIFDFRGADFDLTKQAPEGLYLRYYPFGASKAR